MLEPVLRNAGNVQSLQRILKINIQCAFHISVYVSYFFTTGHSLIFKAQAEKAEEEAEKELRKINK